MPRSTLPQGLAILISLGSLSPLLGQTFTANLTGVVSDPAGADIPNVRVKLENMATREKRETATGAEGRFT